MKCPKCNAELADTAKFCTKCGANIVELKEEEKKKAEEQAKIEKEKKQKEEKTKAENEKKQKAKVEKKAEETVKSELKETAKFEKKKEEKPKKKKHTGIKAFFIILFILIILIGASYGLYKIDLLPDSLNDFLSPIFETVEGWFGVEKEDEEEDTKNTAKNTTNETTETKEIKKKDDSKDLVFDSYDKTMFGATYKIPEINLDYDNIQDINDEIKDLVEDEIKDLEKEKELPEGAMSKADYAWYQNDNILSLVYMVGGYHVDDFYVYNVDIYTGETIENEDILDAAKMDEDEFKTKCSEAVEYYYENYLYDMTMQDNAGSTYKSALKNSTEESNFSTKTQMYLNKNGELCIVAEVETIAGAGTANVLVNVESPKKSNKDELSTATANSNTTNSTNTTNTTNNSTSNSTNTTNSTDKGNTSNNTANNTL